MEAGGITLDRGHSELYSLYEAPGLAFDFAALPCPLEPAAAIACAAQYGLVGMPNKGFGHPEKLVDWEKQSDILKHVFQCYLGIQKALSRDATQLIKLREQVQHLPRINMILERSGIAGVRGMDDPLIIAAAFIAYHLRKGLRPVRLTTYPTATLFELWSRSSWTPHSIDGMFYSTVTSGNLMGVACYQIQNMIREAWQVEICPQCGRFFRIEHKRSRFCSPRCASNARFHRYVERHKEQVIEGGQEKKNV